jgi:ribosomal protein L14
VVLDLLEPVSQPFVFFNENLGRLFHSFFWHVGDEIVCVVKKARPINPSIAGTQAANQKVKKGEVRHGLVVRTKKEMRRPDGRYIRFDDNACILLNQKKEPLGTRVLGVVAAELRQKNWMKAASLAPRIV